MWDLPYANGCSTGVPESIVLGSASWVADAVVPGLATRPDGLPRRQAE